MVLYACADCPYTTTHSDRMMKHLTKKTPCGAVEIVNLAIMLEKVRLAPYIAKKIEVQFNAVYDN